MKIGYARVSTTDQSFDGQIERLKAAGCEKVYSEKMSGKSQNGRHELSRAIKALRPGDILTVCKLDRLARSIKDLLHLMDEIAAAGAKFQALDDPWCNTDTPQGELILNVMASLAQFERRLILQRCAEGIRNAKARGTQFGRPRVLDAGEKRKIAERHSQGDSMALLAREYEVAVGTVYNAIHGQ
jgi:DNA invertase Pin-like site-specific DNA recombinase